MLLRTALTIVMISALPVLGCGTGTQLSFGEAQALFDENSTVFELVVRDLKRCPAVTSVHADGELHEGEPQCIADGVDVRGRISAYLRSMQVLWVTAWRSPSPGLEVSSDMLSSVDFIFYSRGLAPDGSSVSISYFEDPKRDVVGYLSLGKLPSHWWYRRQDD